MPSTRKPYNDCAGYIASRRNEINRGWVVIYVAAEQGIDVGYDPLTMRDYKYATVCELHATICGTSSIPKARPFLKYPEFCEACMADEAAIIARQDDNAADDGRDGDIDGTMSDAEIAEQDRLMRERGTLGAVVASGWTESPEPDLPPCPLVGTDGNAFAVIGRVSRCLKEAGQPDRAAEWVREATSQPSYDALLQTVFRYVDPMPATDHDADRVRVHYPNGSDVGIATFADGRPLLSRRSETS